MCRRSIFLSISGFFLGLLVLGIGGYWGAQRLIVEEIKSPFEFEKTVEIIRSAAAEKGWEVPKVYELCKGLAKHGHDIKPVAVLELCKPDYAASLLSHDATRLVSSFMPCRIAVYQRDDGSVVISRMNTALVSRVFSGKVSKVMALATRETQAIIDQVFVEQREGAKES
jgi:uncharacterized protein (DUF302 family)